MRATSLAATGVSLRNLRLRLLVFLVKRWLDMALRRCSLPVPLTLTRFLVPRCGLFLIFMLSSFLAMRTGTSVHPGRQNDVTKAPGPSAIHSSYCVRGDGESR